MALFPDELVYTPGMDTSTAARQLAAQRKTREKTCPVCGAVFEAFGRREYDTKACANKASYRRVGRKRRSQRATGPTRLARPPAAPSPLDARLDRAHALAEAQWARAEGNLAEAGRWERIAAGMVSNVE
jgi:hypothetical protein